jgi:hypothetical protein
LNKPQVLGREDNFFPPRTTTLICNYCTFMGFGK